MKTRDDTGVGGERKIHLYCTNMGFMDLIFFGVTLNLGVNRLNCPEIKHGGSVGGACFPAKCFAILLSLKKFKTLSKFLLKMTYILILKL